MFGVELHTACDFHGICHQSPMLWILKNFFRTVVLTQATTALGLTDLCYWEWRQYHSPLNATSVLS